MDTDGQLKELVARRDSLRDQVQRVKGKLERAEQEKRDIDAECASRKVDPEQLDTTIEMFEKKLADLVQEIGSDLERAEAALEQFQVKEI